MTTVQSTLSLGLAGAVMITFFAPAVRCTAAFLPSVKMPVDSTTIPTPRSPHGSWLGIPLGKGLDLSPVDHETAFPGLDAAGEAAVVRVVLEQIGQRLVVGQVIDGDDFEIVRVALPDGAEDLATDAAETVDSNSDLHFISSF